MSKAAFVIVVAVMVLATLGGLGAGFLPSDNGMPAARSGDEPDLLDRLARPVGPLLFTPTCRRDGKELALAQGASCSAAIGEALLLPRRVRAHLVEGAALAVKLTTRAGDPGAVVPPAKPRTLNQGNPSARIVILPAGGSLELLACLPSAPGRPCRVRLD